MVLSKDPPFSSSANLLLVWCRNEFLCIVYALNDADFDIDDQEDGVGRKKKKSADESLPIVREVTVMGGEIVQKTVTTRKVSALVFRFCI